MGKCGNILSRPVGVSEKPTESSVGRKRSRKHEAGGEGSHHYRKKAKEHHHHPKNRTVCRLFIFSFTIDLDDFLWLFVQVRENGFVGNTDHSLLGNELNLESAMISDLPGLSSVGEFSSIFCSLSSVSFIHMWYMVSFVNLKCSFDAAVNR